MNTFTGFPADTLPFLSKLKDNNDRSWFEAQKPRFRVIQTAAQEFISAMDAALKSIAPELGGDPRLNGSGSLFRIYRDVRFSKDKSPYKTRLGILFWDLKKKKMTHPGFYLHIDPLRLGLYCGLYKFSTDVLTRYREAVADDKQGSELSSILRVGAERGFRLAEPHYKRTPPGYDVPPDRLPLLLNNVMYFRYDVPQPDVLFTPELIPFVLDIWTTMAPLYHWLKPLA
ncbi:MAG: DUF2461 domain-containing protein [Fidelibacterota bacterium]